MNSLIIIKYHQIHTWGKVATVMFSQIYHAEKQNNEENYPAAGTETGYWDVWCGDINPVKWIPVHCQSPVIKRKNSTY